MKKFFKYLSIMIAVLMVAVIAFIRLFDFNDYKPQIEKLIHKYADIDVKINGDLSVAISLRPTIEINEVTVSLPDGSKVANINNALVQFSIRPLFDKELEIDLLETTDTEIFYDDNERVIIHALNVDMEGPNDPVMLEFSTSVNGVVIDGEGAISSWKELQQNNFSSTDVDAEIRAFGCKMLFKGGVKNSEDKITASGSYDLAYKNNKINGNLDINFGEETPYVKLNVLSDKLDFRALTQTAHNDYFGFLVAEAYAEEYITGTTIPYSSLQMVNADISLDVKNVVLDSNLTLDNVLADIALKDGTLKADIKQVDVLKMKMSGQVDLSSPKSLPYVKLNVKGDVIDLQKFSASTPSKKHSFLNFDWLISQAYAKEYIMGTTIPYRYLQMANADVSLDVKKVVLDKNLTLDNVLTDISLKDGKFNANIKQVDALKMKISGQVGLSSPKSLPYVKLNVKGNMLDLQKFSVSTPLKKRSSLNLNWLIKDAWAASFMSDTKIPYQYLRKANGTVKLNLQKLIVMPEIVLSNVDASFMLQNSVLKADINNVGAGKGKISGTVNIDARSQKAKANLKATNVILQDLYTAWARVDNKKLYIKEGGLTNALINVETNGSSSDAYLRNLDGQILLLTDKSIMHVKSLDHLQGNIIMQILQTLKLSVANKEMHLKCAVLRSDIQNGRMNFPKGIVFDAKDLYLVADGHVSLSNEKINLSIQSFSGKLTNISISSILGSLLKIKGTIEHPELSINRDSTAKSVVGAIATGGAYNVGDMMLSADHAPCHTALAGTMYADHFKADTSVRNSVSKGYNNTQKKVKSVVKDIKKGTKQLKKGITSLFQ